MTKTSQLNANNSQYLRIYTINLHNFAIKNAGIKPTNVDFSIIKRFPFSESRSIEFRAEFFNLFNHVNFANPISNLNAFASSGGSIDLDTGRIINPGDFGRIISTSNNPRLIQFAVKLSY